MPAGLGVERRGRLRGLLAHHVPGGGGDRLVVEVGQIDQPHDRRQAAAEPLQPARVAMIAGRPDARSSCTRWPNRPPHQPGHATAASGPWPRIARHVAHLAGVAEIIPHELFDGQHARRSARSRGAAAMRSCSAAVEHVARLARVKVQLVAQPQQEFVGRLDGRAGPRPRARPAACSAAGSGCRSGRSRSSGAVARRAARPASA